MRQGGFNRGEVQYGQALSIAKPPLNDPGSYISAELLDPALELTLAQQNELQQRIDDLYRILQGEQTYFT